jgi:hypothetical protein
MCLRYRGIEYNYGIDVTLEVDRQFRRFHILMTRYMNDRPYVYGGICLDNGFQVTSDNREKHAAMYEIIKKIVDGTLGVEKVHAERYPSRPFQPFKNILEEDREISEKYTKKMTKSISLEEYKVLRTRLKPLWDTPNPDYGLIKGVLVRKMPSRRTFVRAVLLKKRLVNMFLAVCTFLSILPRSMQVLYDCKDMFRTSLIMQDDPFFSGSKINYCRV